MMMYASRGWKKKAKISEKRWTRRKTERSNPSKGAGEERSEGLQDRSHTIFFLSSLLSQHRTKRTLEARKVNNRYKPKSLHVKTDGLYIHIIHPGYLA